MLILYKHEVRNIKQVLKALHGVGRLNLAGFNTAKTASRLEHATVGL
jgi:hypothetical protein